MMIHTNSPRQGTCPHDVLTTAEAVYPERFVVYARGHLIIHEWAGYSSFVLDPVNGHHRIGVALKDPPKVFLDFMSERMLAE